MAARDTFLTERENPWELSDQPYSWQTRLSMLLHTLYVVLEEYVTEDYYLFSKKFIDYYLSKNEVQQSYNMFLILKGL